MVESYDSNSWQRRLGLTSNGDVTVVIIQLKGYGDGILCAQTSGHASGKSLGFPNRSNVGR